MESTTETLRAEIAQLQGDNDVLLLKIDRLAADNTAAWAYAGEMEGSALRAKLALARYQMRQSCGHLPGDIITDADLGDEGTTFCAGCTREAAKYAAGMKAGAAKWFDKWAEANRDAYAGNEALQALHFLLFCEHPPLGQAVTVDWLAARVRAAWAAQDAPCWDKEE